MKMKYAQSIKLQGEILKSPTTPVEGEQRIQINDDGFT